MENSFVYFLRNDLMDLPLCPAVEGGKCVVDTAPLAEWPLKEPAKLLGHFFSDLPGVSVDGTKILFSGGAKDFVGCRAAWADFREHIVMEHLENPMFWARSRTIKPTGFSEAKEPVSEGLLKEVYTDDFIVQEKKKFLLDLRQSEGAYMVSVERPPSSMIDAAAQIASLNIGLNSKESTPMALRSEIADLDLDLENWDVYQGYARILKERSGLPHAYLASSGSETVEIALKACQTQFPDRREVIAFDGAFHGRTLLSLHCTFNEAKRKPFEIYPGLVEFNSYPEQVDPSLPALDPDGWRAAWADPEGETERVEQFLKSKDPLIAAEAKSLKELCDRIKERPRLAVLIESWQGEGGDRYASGRFYRGLRLLTRSMNTPLIFDEVQAGFGLSGKFFWYELFELVDRDGRPDYPDAVCTAKKSQAAFCLSRFEMKHRVEGSASSLYRGYLQAQAAAGFDYRPLEAKTREYLRALQKVTGEKVIQNPRNIGLAFAFDLPSPEVLGKMIAHRFAHGILFYPAGTKTARFRLMTTTTDRELDQIFVSIYQCLESVVKDGLISELPPAEEALEKISPTAVALLRESAGIERELIWPSEVPKNSEAYLALSVAQWTAWFKAIVLFVPQIVHLPRSREYTLKKLESVSLEDLWSHYESEPGFTLLELMFHGSRKGGHSVSRLNAAQAKEWVKEIADLEALVYEAERQEDPATFIKEADNADAVVLYYRDNSKVLRGLALAAPLRNYSNVEMVASDPLIGQNRALYSVDITIHPDHQRTGLGLRFKIEQMIEGVYDGKEYIRSRNRFPESKGMAALNRKLGSVVLDKNTRDYGGDGCALYQSLPLVTQGKSKKRFRVGSPELLLARHKMALASFVTPSYLNNLLILKHRLPEPMRHIYLSSGRNEATDKMVKLLYKIREQGNYAIGFKGDYFGSNTASARSLGGAEDEGYFNWPVLDGADSLASTLEEKGPDHCLGIFVEPVRALSGERRSPEELTAILKVGREKDVPVIFAESASAHYQYDKDYFFAADKQSLLPDGMIWFAGGQVAVTAVQKKLFLEKPLMMISTWDGDEFSLSRMTDAVLATEAKR